jgi:molybdenum cofactor synthesis domain-containing protein
MRVGVITCSNRSAAGARPDESGAVLAGLLADAGHEVVSQVIVPDDVFRIREAVDVARAHGAAAVITTGGTGLTPTDVTPEAIRPMLHREIPGLSEAIRMVGRDKVPASVLSRGIAGAIGTTLVVTLPGSPGGVRDGMAVLLPLLDHAVQQLNGSDHHQAGGI